ncbi:hypothetical protein [Desulfobulbus alkaliphilus]|uniref:hypothetical protein n=1 Tax=Desulfobulbus alkaliphilus TaxID=869814 RepID=UPI001965AA0D|nr:hypothetical protein [Desulfobulbus alkaliphilus]MBM9536192.1 hypothetical protein [Desulfobulbus alkaliphilus]
MKKQESKLPSWPEESTPQAGMDPIIRSLVQYRTPVSLQNYLDLAFDGTKLEDLPAEQRESIPPFLLDPKAKPLDPSDPYYEEILELIDDNPLLTIERAREYLDAMY